MSGRSFEELFSGAYQRAKTSGITKLSEARDAAPLLKAEAVSRLGHPDFEHLQVGQTRDGQGVVFFLDIRGFTKLSFVLSNNELLWILQALTVAAVNSVLQFGGHVIEFTGDGVMAVFGDSRTNAEAAAFSALSTTAFLMKGVQETVNPRLENFGTETVRTAVGMEFGDILWSRIGVLNTTQVKPISEATFLAGKLSCGGKTKAWEAMVGANLAEWIPSDFKVQVPKYKFMADGVEYSRDLFLFKWAQFATSNQISNSKLKELLFRKKLRSTVQKSPYLAALKLLTEAGFNVFLDDSSDCPHLVINFDVEGTIAVIITLDIDSVRKAPSVFLRQHGQLEKIEISTEQWIESSGNLTSIVAALRNAQMRR